MQKKGLITVIISAVVMAIALGMFKIPISEECIKCGNINTNVFQLISNNWFNRFDYLSWILTTFCRFIICYVFLIILKVGIFYLKKGWSAIISMLPLYIFIICLGIGVGATTFPIGENVIYGAAILGLICIPLIGLFNNSKVKKNGKIEFDYFYKCICVSVGIEFILSVVFSVLYPDTINSFFTMVFIYMILFLPLALLVAYAVNKIKLKLERTDKNERKSRRN